MPTPTPAVEVLLHGDGFRTSQGSAAFCATLLITGATRTVVDTGHVGRRTPLVAALAARGLTPADVDNVVLTHTHWDHVQNADLFPNARVLLHQWERQYARAPHANDWATPRWTNALLESLEQVEAVEDGFEVEPGVRLLHTPGHSAGTMAAIVDTAKGPVAVTGDGIQNTKTALTGTNSLVFWSADDARRSIARVLAEAEIIYPGHDLPFRMLKGGGTEYLAARELTFFGVSGPGVALSEEERPAFQMPGIETQRLAD
jgi:N-acyl homoserine lactone hydrolase